jgi:hypothetical protein
MHSAKQKKIIGLENPKRKANRVLVGPKLVKNRHTKKVSWACLHACY